MNIEGNGTVLEEAREKLSDDIARRVRAAVGELLAKGDRLSFYAVAKKAQVSRSTLYRRGDLRELVESARSHAGTEEPCTPPSVEGLTREVEALKRENAALRSELAMALSGQGRRRGSGRTPRVEFHTVLFDMAA